MVNGIGNMKEIRADSDKTENPKEYYDHMSIVVNIIGFILSMFFIMPPLIPYPGIPSVSVSVIYYVTLFVFWPIQISYHYLELKEKHSTLLQKIDRASMLYLIAALFTPILNIYCGYPVGSVISLIQWIGSIGVLILFILIKNLPRSFAPIFSFIIGLSGILTVIYYIENMPIVIRWQFLAGVLFFIAAGAVYSAKKPDIIRRYYGFHELFHTLLTIGVILLLTIGR